MVYIIKSNVLRIQAKQYQQKRRINWLEKFFFYKSFDVRHRYAT